MLAVGPLGPQYSLLFAWHELGRHAHLGVDTLPSQKVPQKILKKSISLYLWVRHTQYVIFHCHFTITAEWGPKYKNSLVWCDCKPSYRNYSQSCPWCNSQPPHWSICWRGNTWKTTFCGDFPQEITN